MNQSNCDRNKKKNEITSRQVFSTKPDTFLYTIAEASIYTIRCCHVLHELVFTVEIGLYRDTVQVDNRRNHERAESKMR
jgi:hypothetical protein